MRRIRIRIEFDMGRESAWPMLAMIMLADSVHREVCETDCWQWAGQPEKVSPVFRFGVACGLFHFHERQ